MANISITSYSAICDLGTNVKEIFENSLLAGKNFFTPDENIIKGKKLYLGKVSAVLPKIKEAKFDTRTNALLLHCCNAIQNDIDAVVKKYGKDRIGVVIGTTNAGVNEYEKSHEVFHSQIGSPALFLKEHLGLNGYCSGVSTACTSGIKAFSTGVKLLENGICDAVLCGAADAVSKVPVFGFSALEVMSQSNCKPFSKNRDGINIGEGAALFILEKDVNKGIRILGIGETSDAYHGATPDPEGTQAAAAITQALEQAGLKPDEIDYINLHGTGTVSNDIMEANAVYKVFKDKVPVSSTKSLTGHCLGASSGVESALCLAFLEDEINKEKFLIPHNFDGVYDDTLPEIKLAKRNEKAENNRYVMCNAFGFGGSNAVIIFGKNQASEQKSDCFETDLSKILPHDAPMILIDKILDVNIKENYVKTQVEINKDKVFYDAAIEGVSPLAGIEFMAQTIGCYSYFKRGGGDPKIGFLLGSRSYNCSLEKFENGKSYEVIVREVFGDNELVSFECFIYNDGIECAKAVVNAYQPENFDNSKIEL